MSYDDLNTDDVESYHWGYSMYNRFVNGSLSSPVDMTGPQKLAMLLAGGTSDNWNTFESDPFYYLSHVVFLVISHLPLLGAVVLVMAGICVCSGVFLGLYNCCSRRYPNWRCWKGRGQGQHCADFDYDAVKNDDDEEDHF